MGRNMLTIEKEVSRASNSVGVVMRSGGARFAGRRAKEEEARAHRALPSQVRKVRAATSVPRSRGPAQQMRSAEEGGAAAGAVYNIEASGPKKDLAYEVATSAQTYSILRSTTPRFGHRAPTECEVNDLEYDVDQTAKASLVAALARSPCTYAHMRKGAPRFRNDRRALESAHLGPGHVQGIPEKPGLKTVPGFKFEAVPGRQRPSAWERASAAPGEERPLVLDLEARGAKQSMVNRSAASAQVVSSMRSTTARFGPVGSKDRAATEAAANYRPLDLDGQLGNETMSAAVRSSGRSYRTAMGSKQARFTGPATDRYLQRRLAKLAYDPDVGQKETLASAVKRSRRGAAALKGPKSRFTTQRETWMEAPGPGAYDSEAGLTLVSKRRAGAINLGSGAPRFPKAAAKGGVSSQLGSNFSMKAELAAWQGPKAYLSRTSRPAINASEGNDLQYDTDKGAKASIGTLSRRAAAAGPSLVMRSKEPRLLHPRVFLTNDTRSRAPPPLHEAAEGKASPEYDIDITCNSRPNSVLNAVRKSSKYGGVPQLSSPDARFKPEGDRQFREAMNNIDFRATDHLSLKQSVDQNPNGFSEAFRGLGRAAPTVRR